MKINAIVTNKAGNTLVLDLPRSFYDMYEKLQSVGIAKSPNQIKLTDEEDDDVQVKLSHGRIHDGLVPVPLAGR